MVLISSLGGVRVKTKVRMSFPDGNQFQADATLWASYQIRKIAGNACAGNAGNVFPRRRFQRKLLVSDPGMHHGTCVTHVPWCMSGSLTCGDGENVPGIPGACASAIFRIWQEAHSCEKFRLYNTSHILMPAIISLPYRIGFLPSLWQG